MSVEFKYGMVVGMDYESGLRLMVVAPNPKKGLKPGTWDAIVLADHTWPIGLFVTTRPDAAGLIVIEDSSGREP
jgi:hypothetical protein